MSKLMSNELVHGQVVIVFARWLLLAAGLLVALWNPPSLRDLQIEIGVLLLVAIANFHLHASLLRRRPMLRAVAYVASLGDLLIVSLLVALQGGATSTLYVFYFPALLAIAVAFGTFEAASLGAVGLTMYALIVAVSVPGEVLLLRELMMAAVLVIGNLYWRLHREAIQPTASTQLEAAQDLFFGQASALWARWFLILGGALLVLVRATSTDQLAIQIVPVVLLLFMNFYLHGRYLVDRPANTMLTVFAGGLDLVLTTAVFLSWSGPPGIGNPSFVLFYPLVFAFTLVFGPRIGLPYAALSMVLYTALVLPAGIAGVAEWKLLVLRLLSLGAMGGLGTLYWRIVRREVTRHADEAHATLAWRAAGTS
jgi:hypothetical protein